MAKALPGFATGIDHRAAARASAENRVLRQRIADLEDTVLRLSQENDALAALVREHDLERAFELA